MIALSEEAYLSVVKAFRDCRRNHAKSRSVASYLARQGLAGAGVKNVEKVMPAVDEMLDRWFAARTKNPAFKPLVWETEAPAVQTGNLPLTIETTLEPTHGDSSK